MGPTSQFILTKKTKEELKKLSTHFDFGLFSKIIL